MVEDYYETANGNHLFRNRALENTFALRSVNTVPPYTPLDLERSAALNRSVLDGSRIKGARYPNYHSLKVRLDRRFSFSGSNLILYAACGMRTTGRTE